MRTSGLGILGLALLLALTAACELPTKFVGETVSPPFEAPPVRGTNWDGQPFDLADHSGKVTALFFGFTYCPDVCPMTLANLKRVSEELGESAEDLRVVFISVDPERDSPQQLKSYVPGFNKNFYGVHIAEGPLRQVLDGFDAVVQYGPRQEDANGVLDYLVDHTPSTFLIDRQGDVRVKHEVTSTPTELATDIRALM